MKFLLFFLLSLTLLANEQDEELSKASQKIQVLQAKAKEIEHQLDQLNEKLAKTSTDVSGNESKSETKTDFFSPFEFGSYGRIGISTNFDGGRGRDLNIVSHGARIEKSPYQELWMKYDFSSPEAKAEEIKVRLMFTLALTDNYFHYDGKFDTKMAIRQCYIDVDNVFSKNLNLWVGSRMYRGDDIYLLDFWPLNNLNTMGAGAIYHFNEDKSKGGYIQLHTGVNSLDQGDTSTPYQYSYYYVPKTGTVETERILLLDRQRSISSLLFGYQLPELKLNFKLYGEFYYIGDGTYKKELNSYSLPSDNGWSAGLQTTYYGFGKNSFVHLFIKYSSGLASYGEMGIPYGVNTSNTTSGAGEFLVGVASNFETDQFGLMFGGYYRYFQDADDNKYDSDDLSEGIAILRFQYYLTNIFHLAAETSFQMQQRANLNPETFKQETPSLFKFAFMPTISPNGKGTYMQPQIRLIYSISKYNDSGKLLFEEADPLRGKDIHHYLGITAEWWFNSL
ncbi:carbohydrate porin [bacterium]|nr:carbohydrate porin [bacterium]